MYPRRREIDVFIEYVITLSLSFTLLIGSVECPVPNVNKHWKFK